ncbi:MAG: hypothetical protein U0744_01885 [Gemmataceae bacterium]
MILHFNQAKWPDIVQRLDQIARNSNGLDCVSIYWHFPNTEGYLVSIYEYADHFNEMEPEEFDRLIGELGGPPSCAICLELRRSKGRAAHDAAARIATMLLTEFDGIAQDITCTKYWRLSDLTAGAAIKAADMLWPNG